MNKDGTITETVASCLCLEGSIDEVVNKLHTLQQLYSVDYDNLRLATVSRRYEDGEEFVLQGDRPATSAEVAAYEKIRMAQTEDLKVRELAKLAELKAKYE